ncbi:MAG: DNA repair protein RecO [Candidatus Dormibacteraeota bacterium]|nr:DNA repair protein RecO [Candidatus Dormibacteraeota bacterium]
MTIYTAEAVILRKVDYGEADRILTLLTRERGKVPAIAKSVRKSRSRMSGQLDVFAHGTMLLAEGKSMDVVTQFQRITENSALGSDLRRAAVASVVVEVADKIMEERHAAPEMFTLVVEALRHLSDRETTALMELADFLMRVLGELGYTPELNRCARCGGPLGEEGLAFSALAGGVVCIGCSHHDRPAMSVSARSVKILRVLASGDRDLFFRLRLEEADNRAIESVLEAQLEHHLDRQLKSIDFLRRVH